MTRTTNSPAELLKVINDQMFGILPDSDFLTVFYGVINLETRELVYTNAGHPRPFLFRPSEGAFEELEIGGPLVGALSGIDYEDGRVQLERGDRILVFTDGVTEALSDTDDNSLDDFYGLDRLKQMLVNNCNCR